jgi:hypothetical protein
MATPFRLDTSGIIPFGPVIKSTDGYNPLTGMTSANMTISFIHAGATATGDWSTWAQTANQNVTELVNGYYTLTLSSNPLSKVGRVRIEITASGSSGIPIVEEIQVLPTYVYDSIVASSGTDYLFDDDAQSTRRLSELCNTGDLWTTSKSANVGAIAGEIVTTDAADNWDNFWFNTTTGTIFGSIMMMCLPQRQMIWIPYFPILYRQLHGGQSTVVQSFVVL